MKKSLIILVLSSTFIYLAHAEESSSSREMKRGKPPQEALEACEGQSSGDSCSFEGRRGTANGVCFTPESSKPLACKPERR